MSENRYKNSVTEGRTLTLLEPLKIKQLKNVLDKYHTIIVISEAILSQKIK